MEDQGNIPPGLPRANPTISYWQDPPDKIADLRSTDLLPDTADIVIIGSGISGSCIANNLLDAKSHCKAVMLEARQAASGASGRNGGHTKGASYRTFDANLKAVGEKDAMKIARLEYNCMVAVHDFIKQNGIQCDSRRLDTLDVYYDEAQWKGAKVSVTEMENLMGAEDPASKYTFWNSEDTASKFMCPGSLGSLSYEAGSLSAYKLTIGVLKLALAKGLNLQTETPVTSLERNTGSGEPYKWIVTTTRGSIRAAKGVIVPLRGIITAQRPGKNMPQTGLEMTYSFCYDKSYEYMISRPAGSKNEGDIVIGGGSVKTPRGGLEEYGESNDTVLNEDIVNYLTGTTSTYFGENWGEDHPDGRVRRAWSGVMGYSADGHPLVGPIPGEDGLYIDASFQGHGMVLCFLCAQAASKMILGEGEDELEDWFPDAYRISEARMQNKFKGRSKGLNEATEPLRSSSK